MLSSAEIEAELLGLVARVRSTGDRTVERSLGVFPEQDDGHPAVAELFARVVAGATGLWGPPRRRARGPSTVDGDVAGVPPSLWNTRTLEYAWWSPAGLAVAINVDTHDADTLRSITLLADRRPPP